MISIKINTSDLKRLEKLIRDAKPTRAQAQRVANNAVVAMKDSIAKGLSPIAGKGRFAAYKNPSRYPGDLKPQRPVNLKLTGDMLAALQAKALSGETIEIGYFDSVESKKEQEHRDGARGQPRRPTIPEGSERFTQSITDQMSEEFAKALDEQLTKNGK